MNHEQFIQKNVQAELLKLGFSLSVSSMASDRAVDHYRRSTATGKGKVMADCMHTAKAWAEKYSGQKAKPKSK